MTPQPSCRVSIDWSSDPAIVKESLDPTVAAWTVALSVTFGSLEEMLVWHPAGFWKLQSTAAFLACLCRGRSSRPHVCLVLWLLLLTMPLEAGHGPHFCKALAGHSSDWAL